MGPALLPENLSRLKKPEAARVIRESRPGVQMPAFKAQLRDEDIAALVELIYTPLVPAPAWTEADIHVARGTTPRDAAAAPQFKADPTNLFVVVEAGDHHVIDLDYSDRPSRSTASLRASRCTAGPSSRPTGATCSSPRATAGSPSSTCGT
jgi:hypothetical protein